jgi:hypothetical protein
MPYNCCVCIRFDRVLQKMAAALVASPCRNLRTFKEAAADPLLGAQSQKLMQ